MAAVAPIIRILPAILKLFPKLRAPPEIVRGKVIPLNNVLESPDSELERALNRKVTVKKKEDFNDKAHVLRVSDAIKCVEDLFSDGKFTAKALAEIAAILQDVLLGGKGSDAPYQLAEQLAKCFREKALKQTAPRKRITYRYSKRAI